MLREIDLAKAFGATKRRVDDEAVRGDSLEANYDSTTSVTSTLLRVALE